MSILIILASKSFLVIVAGYDWTFFRPFRLMGQHVSLEVLEQSSTFWVGASTPLFAIVVKSQARGAWTLLRIARMG